MALVSKAFGDIITFTRASGATWTNPAGNIVGVDFSATSNTIGTGSKTFTLSATAGVNRSWASGDSVLISDQSNSANNMTGTVTSYTAATQTLVVNVTSTGGSGTIASWRVGSLMPRFDYDPVTLAAKGLLIEEQRVNLLTQSEFASGVPAGVGLITASTMLGPDGNSVNAAAFGHNGTTDTYLYKSSVTASTQYAISAYVRMDDGNAPVFQNSVGNASTNDFALVISGSAVNPLSYIVTNVGNSLYRVSAVVTSGTTNLSSNGIVKYGSNTNRTFKTTAWQIEAGAFATSYIPTVASQVTRSADVASVNTLSPWYNATEGTLYTDAALYGYGSASMIAAFTSGSTNVIQHFYNSATSLRYSSVDASVLQAELTQSGISLNTAYKMASAFKLNDFAVSVNGGSVLTDTSGTVPSVTTLGIGNRNSLLFFNGHIRRITYYPRKLSSAELQAITA